MTLLRKAGLVIGGLVGVILGLVADELAWRRTMPRV